MVWRDRDGSGGGLTCSAGALLSMCGMGGRNRLALRCGVAGQGQGGPDLQVRKSTMAGGNWRVLLFGRPVLWAGGRAGRVGCGSDQHVRHGRRNSGRCCVVGWHDREGGGPSDLQGRVQARMCVGGGNWLAAAA